MTNHLRYCPKHRKPLPCPHCAAVAAKPSPMEAHPELAPVAAIECVTILDVPKSAAQRIGPPLDEAPPDPWADRDPYLNELAAPLKFTDKAEKIRKDKEAQRGRERRKLRREQLAAIKRQLKVPLREIKRRAEELELALKSESSDMSRGAFMTDAPTSKGRMVYSQKIEQIGAAAGRAVALGGETLDLGTGEAFWPEHDRRHVKPEGVGEQSNEKQRPGDPEAESRFVVKAGTDLDYGQALVNLFHRLSEQFVCRLCYQDCVSRTGGDSDEGDRDSGLMAISVPGSK